MFGGLYAVLLADLPKSRAFHAVSTGYAGMLMARAAIETMASLCEPDVNAPSRTPPSR